MFISLREKGGKKEVVLKNQSGGWKSFPVPSVRIGRFVPGNPIPASLAL